MEGIAFADTDGDFIKGPGEPGVPGAVMVLKKSGTESYTATSGADGVYRFDAVAPGQYTLSEKSPPPGYLHNTVYSITFQVQANEPLTDFNVGHQAAADSDADRDVHAANRQPRLPTATPTATPTVDIHTAGHALHLSAACVEVKGGASSTSGA